MTEIELKIKINKKQAEFIREKLRTPIMPRTWETTTMYDNKDQEMIITDGRLRIRTGWKNSVSYKKPLTREGIKKEIEFEIIRLSELRGQEKVESDSSTASFSMEYKGYQ